MARYPKVPSIALAMEHTYRCKSCGMPDNLGRYKPSCQLIDLMRSRTLCYHCAFWQNEISNPTPNREIIGGTAYLITPSHEDFSKFGVGCGSILGAKCYIYKPDGSVYRSFFISKLGEVPERFKDELPDTAKFITAYGFYRILINNFKCRAKGCWDRYHCVRYDMSVEKNGPYNIIPEYCKVGDEQCSSFINKDKELFEKL